MTPPVHHASPARAGRRVDVSTLFVYVLVVGALVVEVLLIARLS